MFNSCSTSRNRIFAATTGINFYSNFQGHIMAAGIRSDGRVVKCTTALEDPRNVIGKISENGQLSINPDLVKLWMVGFASGKTGELACPLHKVSTMKVPGGKKIIPIVEQI